VSSAFGLYCPPERRFALSLSGRTDDTPIYRRVAPAVDKLPAFLRERLIQEFDRRLPLEWMGESTENAADWFKAITARLIRRKLSTAFDTEEIRLRAQKMAILSRREKIYPLIKRVASFQQLPMPLGNRDSTEKSLAARCFEPRVWRRIIDVAETREAENCLRELGFINRRENLYCSDLARRWWAGKQRAQVDYLKSHAVESDMGEQLSLFDVQQKSVSNPVLRRAELMTRMRGFEDIAKAMGHKAGFWTLTCPSRYHSVNADGTANPNYDGSSVRDAQIWLSKMWARSRSELKKRAVLIYGFRVAEPHHDGTPHWHMVLFTVAHSYRRLRFVLRKHWLSDSGTESGAAHHRIKSKAIDDAKGSATGYISKYIAKNIDGYEVGEDFEADQTPGSVGPEETAGTARAVQEAGKAAKNTDASNTAQRVRAWASLHGIRQFQQIGGPTVTLYRELRRLGRNSRRQPDAAFNVDVAPIERARVPADAGNWAGYVTACGGIEAGRRGPLSLWKECAVEENGYGDQRPARNAYGEECAAQIVGIASMVGRLKTRDKAWRIIRIFPDSALGPVSITVPGAVSLSDPHGWTNPNETSMYGPKFIH
jgi:hypothetical protein